MILFITFLKKLKLSSYLRVDKGDNSTEACLRKSMKKHGLFNQQIILSLLKMMKIFASVKKKAKLTQKRCVKLPQNDHLLLT